MKIRIVMAGVVVAGAALAAVPVHQVPLVGAWDRAEASEAVVSAVDPVTPAPPDRIAVLSLNAGEWLDQDDIDEPQDTLKAAYRIQAVLKAMDNYPGREIYAPDVVLLQEVIRQSGARFADQLSAKTGLDYKVAVGAAPDVDAWACATCDTSSPKLTNSTAILYNAGTMELAATPGAGFSRLVYPASVLKTGKQYIQYGAATVKLKKKISNQEYAFYSLHYRTTDQIQNQSGYTVEWTNFLKKRIHDHHGDTAIPIIGGDTNNASGAYVAPFATDSTSSPGSYEVARPGGVDVIASTAHLLDFDKDYDYKNYKPDPDDGYFDNDGIGAPIGFIDCDNLFKVGKGMTQAAANIDGCREKYYSDHAFVWAVFQP